MNYTLRIITGLIIEVLFIATLNSQDRPVVNKSDFFPFSVWYSGGKARATMLSEVTPASREECKKDIQQILETLISEIIKSIRLGQFFNTGLITHMIRIFL